MLISQDSRDASGRRRLIWQLNSRRSASHLISYYSHSQSFNDQRRACRMPSSGAATAGEGIDGGRLSDSQIRVHPPETIHQPLINKLWRLQQNTEIWSNRWNERSYCSTRAHQLPGDRRISNIRRRFALLQVNIRATAVHSTTMTMDDDTVQASPHEWVTLVWKSCFINFCQEFIKTMRVQYGIALHSRVAESPQHNQWNGIVQQCLALPFVRPVLLSVQLCWSLLSTVFFYSSSRLEENIPKETDWIGTNRTARPYIYLSIYRLLLFSKLFLASRLMPVR